MAAAAAAVAAAAGVLTLLVATGGAGGVAASAPALDTLPPPTVDRIEDRSLASLADYRRCDDGYRLDRRGRCRLV